MKLTTSALTLTLLAANAATAGSHTPAEAALDDAIAGCIRIVAQGIPPVRALPGAKEMDGKWQHTTDVSTTTFDPTENWCDIRLPSMEYQQDTAMKVIRNKMLGANITDLQDRDIGRVMRGLIGDLNGKWVHVGASAAGGGTTGSQYMVIGQK